MIFVDFVSSVWPLFWGLCTCLYMWAVCASVYQNIGAVPPVKYTLFASHVTNAVTYTRALWYATLSKPSEWLNKYEDNELFLFQSCFLRVVSLWFRVWVSVHTWCPADLCVCVSLKDR